MSVVLPDVFNSFGFSVIFGGFNDTVAATFENSDVISGILLLGELVMTSLKYDVPVLLVTTVVLVVGSRTG